MNNRKPRNKRGVLTRRQWVQDAPEVEMITVKGRKIPNPDFGKTRRIVHTQIPKWQPKIF